VTQKKHTKEISGRWNSSILMGMGVDGISKAIKYRADTKDAPDILGMPQNASISVPLKIRYSLMNSLSLEILSFIKKLYKNKIEKYFIYAVTLS